MAEKRKYIEISESESESSLAQSDDDESVLEISSSTSCDDDDVFDDNEYEGDDDEFDDESELYGSQNEEDDGHVDEDDEESIYNRVVQSIRGKCDLQELKLVECRVYLRRHGLRLSGTKKECIQRMQEHWRMKDGNGEAFYPRSSFTIDCTGDVCKGDVVMFSQKVYQTFDKMRRHGSPAGRRTIAGRIVKESYGAAKQQHTFTVEVLWSKGTKKLAPLFPLLVKGRNLYKLKTFRQRWKNERERLKVIAEKHQRGAAARTVRAMRKAKAVTKTNRSLTQKGTKRGKHSHRVGPSGTEERSHAKDYVNKRGMSFAPNRKRNHHQNFSPFYASSARDLIGSASHSRHQYPIRENEGRGPSYFPYNYPSRSFDHFQSDFPQREQHHFPLNRDSASMDRLPYSHHHPNSAVIYPAYPHSSRPHESTKFNHVPISRDYQSFHLSPSERYRRGDRY